MTGLSRGSLLQMLAASGLSFVRIRADKGRSVSSPVLAALGVDLGVAAKSVSRSLPTPHPASAISGGFLKIDCHVVENVNVDEYMRKDTWLAAALVTHGGKYS
jgi:hypothetical protein